MSKGQLQQEGLRERQPEDCVQPINHAWALWPIIIFCPEIITIIGPPSKQFTFNQVTWNEGLGNLNVKAWGLCQPQVQEPSVSNLHPRSGEVSTPSGKNTHLRKETGGSRRVMREKGLKAKKATSWRLESAGINGELPKVTMTEVSHRNLNKQQKMLWSEN